MYRFIVGVPDPQINSPFCLSWTMLVETLPANNVEGIMHSVHAKRTITDHLWSYILNLVDQPVINHSTANLLEKLIKCFYFTHTNCTKGESWSEGQLSILMTENIIAISLELKQQAKLYLWQVLGLSKTLFEQNR